MKCLLMLPSPPLTYNQPSSPQVTIATAHKYHLLHTIHSYCMERFVAMSGTQWEWWLPTGAQEKRILANSVTILSFKHPCHLHLVAYTSHKCRGIITKGNCENYNNLMCHAENRRNIRQFCHYPVIPPSRITSLVSSTAARMQHSYAERKWWKLRNPK
jgi:hypothetical protein